jgi:hypothetical protein
MGVQDRDWMWGQRKKRRSVPLYLQIAVGVALGVIASAAVIRGYQIWQLRVAAQTFQEAMRAQAAALESQRLRERQAAEQARREAIARTAARQRNEEALKRAVSEEKARKELAWENFYRKPAKCDDATGGSWTVDCANQFIRAKRDFEEKYASGRL